MRAEPLNHADALRDRLTRRTIPTLDGFRALAAWSVVFYHCGLATPGDQAVVAFFMLSGLLITWLLLREEAREGHYSIRAFYLRRTLRIFPAFYAYWAVGLVALLVSHHSYTWANVVLSFTYLSNWLYAVRGVEGGPFSHCWSLAIEEQFYIAWPLLFRLLRRAPGGRAPWLAGLIVLLIVHRAIGAMTWASLQYVERATDMRVDALLIGGLVAVVVYEKRADRLLGKLIASPWHVLAVLGLMTLAWRWRPESLMLKAVVELCTLDPWLYAIFLLGLVRWAHHPGVRWLDLKPVSWLGSLSYSVYLWHQLPVGIARTMLADRLGPTWQVAAIAATLACAVASYYLIERPFLRLKDRLSKRLRPLTAASVGPS